jgi:hypothetical protein
MKDNNLKKHRAKVDKVLLIILWVSLLTNGAIAITGNNATKMSQKNNLPLVKKCYQS